MPPPGGTNWRVNWSVDGGAVSTTEYATLDEALTAVDSLVSTNLGSATYANFWLEEIATAEVYNKSIMRMA